MRFAVVVFPGSNCDRDTLWALRSSLGQKADFVWHQEQSLEGFDAVILPGGFSYGDYLRSGAVAAQSPIMSAVREFAEKGWPVLGICNGFQVLAESGLLPGALRVNESLQFQCHYVHIRVEREDTPFTGRCRPGQILWIPIAHRDGNYYADPSTMSRLESQGRIIFRYSDSHGRTTSMANPNGSLSNIAGVSNRRGNVLGMMPHPERASDELLGSRDGLLILGSLVDWLSGEGSP